MTGSTEDVRQLRTEVRTFIDQWQREGKFVPRIDAWMRAHDRSFTTALAERGWIGITWPTDLGGGGRSNTERFVITEELLRAGAPVAAHWMADRQIGPALLHHGTRTLQEEFLPRIARGEITFCIGMSETEAGSDLAAIRTRAVRDGSVWTLNGQKIWTTHAHRAEYAYVLARTSDDGGKHDGLTEFIVEMSHPGVSVEPIHDLNGEHHFNQVIFEDVTVPNGHVIGTVGQGWKQVTEQLALERGGPERVLSTYPLLVAMLEATEVSNASDLFLHTLGQVAATLLALRQLAWQVAVATDAGVPLIREAAVLKHLGTRFERTLVEDVRRALDIAPIGESPLAVSLAESVLAAPAFTIQGGTSEMLLSIIAREAAS